MKLIGLILSIEEVGGKPVDQVRGPCHLIVENTLLGHENNLQQTFILMALTNELAV
jgi:hypothetical protein